MSADELESLFSGPVAAVITTTRRDGSSFTTPVWVNRTPEAVEIVMVASDGKVAQLRRHPDCSIVVFETVPPFRGVELRGEAKVERRDDVTTLRRSIARRYLGAVAGDRFAEGREGVESVVVSLPLQTARTWDLRGITE